MRNSFKTMAIHLPVAALLLALATGAAAQQATPDSVRPMDTEPSIPVQTPELGERPADIDEVAGDTAGGAAGGYTTDPAPREIGSGDGAGDAGVGSSRAAAPPATLRAHWHVYIAFTVAWVLLFGYALTLGARMKRLQRELAGTRE